MLRADRAANLHDFNTLRAFCHARAAGSTRDLMMLSLDETRAICSIAADGLDLFERICALAELSDAAASPETIKAELTSLIEFVRPIMRTPS